MKPAADPQRHPHPTLQLEVFATGSTIATVPEAAVAYPLDDHDGQTLSGLLKHGGDVIRDGFEHARDLQARPGHRIGGGPTFSASARSGGDDDIVRPVLVPPLFAGEFAACGELFAAPIPHLHVAGRRGHEQQLLLWDCELHGDSGRCQVTFHLMASPSMVVTVLELVPCQRIRRRRRDRFLADGIAAMEAIAARLLAAAPVRATA
jgi:hypothetical protein